MTEWSTWSRSARRTMNLGTSLGRLLQGGEIIGLKGELGAGKTCFVRGVTQGLDVRAETWIRSPTFTLINEYQGRVPIYHIDLYRVSEPGQADGLNLREYLYSEGVSLIEWFEYLADTEVDEYLEVLFAHVSENQRKIHFIAHGEQYDRIIEKLRSKSLQESRVAQS